MEDLRYSGLDIIGSVPWGTHIGHLYSSKEEMSKIVVPFLSSGLCNNELCVWVYSKNISFEEAKKILHTCIRKVDMYIENGQLILLPYNQWYVINSSFDKDRVNQQWRDTVKAAKDKGYAGLRAAGDTDWLEKYHKKEFAEYDEDLNDVLSDLEFIALCLYDTKRISIPEVAEIMNNHNITIISDESGFKPVRNTKLLASEKQLSENRRMLEEIMDYDKLKTEFLSNISHELRTPLNVILSTIHLLGELRRQGGQNSTDDTIAARESRYLKIIRQNCLRQLRLVNNIIDIAKMDSNFFELHLQTCNIVEIVENITLSIAEHIESNGISLVFDTDVEEVYISCDPDQIERIILNLLSNAIKFTNPGGSIWVSMHSCPEKVTISVKDTGIGIPPDKLEYIFDRFRQVDMTLTRSHEGSGIGLSLVKSLVEKHNGNIRVKSELGKGSEFIIELPREIIPKPLPDTHVQRDISTADRVEKIMLEFSDIYA